ncbi:MAG: 6-phosphofructokinase, partial [Nitrospiria bacterium]
TIIDRYKRGSRFSIVIVAEGAKPAGGKRSLIKPTEGGSAERLGGVGNKVGEEIARLMEMDVRVTVLGHLQRGGSPTPFDRILATRFGIAAVNLIAQKRFGEMVCLKGSEIKSVPLSEATRKMKRVPSNGALVRNAETIGVSFGR